VVLGTPVVLFGSEMGSHIMNRTYSWDVNAAGDRFVALEPVQTADDRPPLMLVRGWTAPKNRK
jgi:hypothetical protein